MLRTLSAVLFLFLLPLHTSSAASLVTDTNGILTGVSGIEYLGKKYDVAFRDGSCVGLFDGCNEQSDFPFQAGDTTDAIRALVTVLVADTRFDEAPGLIQGCVNTFRSRCIIIMPFDTAPSENGVLYFRADMLLVQSGAAPSFLKPSLRQAEVNTAIDAETTFAVWTQQPTTTVPEPSTLMLLGIGLLGQRWLRRGTRILPA